MTSSTPKPRAGENMPTKFPHEDNPPFPAGDQCRRDSRECIEMEAERDTLRERFETTVATTIRLIAERDALRVELEAARAQALADRAFQSENISLRERERELVELLKAHLAHTTQSIKDIGGCDHSVGICCCDMIADCDVAQALLAKARP